MDNVYRFVNVRAKVTNANFPTVNKKGMELFANRGFEILLEEHEWFNEDDSFTPLNEIQKHPLNLLISE